MLKLKEKIQQHPLVQRINKSDIGHRMASGASWSFTGTALAKFIVLVAGIACAHVLGKHEYGQFGMVRSTISLFVVFGFAGMGLTATKFISEYKKDHKERIPSIYLLTNGFAILTGLLVAIAILFLAPTIADRTLNAPELVVPLRVGALLLFVTVINGAQQGTLAGFENFKAIALNTLIGSIAESVLMLIGGYYWGVTGAVLGFGSGFIVLYVANNISIRKNFLSYGLERRLSLFDKKDLHLLYKFSLPAMLSSLMVAPVFWIVRTMLVNYTNFEELAVYEAADQWKVIILFIPAAVSHVALPILSSLVNDSQERYWKTLRYNILLNASISAIFALIVCLCSSFIMHFYGKGYTDPMPLVYLVLSTIFTSISTVVGISIQSQSKMWTGFGFNLFWGLMVIGFSYLFLNYGMGASGVALGIMCAYAVHAVLQYVYLRISVQKKVVANG